MVGRAGAGALASGICVALFVAYCVYFDRKRRRDPELKAKLRERRRRKRREEEGTSTSNTLPYPDPNDSQAVRAYFLEEMELGEGSLAQGDVQVGVEHLSNAFTASHCPRRLLRVLQRSVPPPVFHLLLSRLSTERQ